VEGFSVKRKLRVKVIGSILLAVLVVLTTAVLAQDSNIEVVIQGCPHGQGYWANHSEAWTVTNIMMGVQFYSQAELLAILPGGGGDASTILAVQLASTKLNIAAGADASQISATMLQADALLAQFGGKLPYNVAPSAPEGQAMVSLARLLDLYNNGQMSPNCTPTPPLTEEPQPTPEVSVTEAATETVSSPGTTIIIEGPVQVINVNIITIYDINIEVDDHDPVLTNIHVGDFVRVEGNAVNGPTLIVVAVTVFVVNIDVVVSNNNVVIWQDDGRNCGNPPPPWAPANGWRRRCENHTTTIIITGGSGNNGMGMGMGDDD
jgi:hypothetical protein